MNEMGGNDNPLTKLNEAVEILDMFEEGVLPQLREKFEANVITERDRLQELVEKTMRVQSEVGVDVETLKENAISLAAEGSAYKAAALDYQQLSEQLADKLSSLMEDHKDLQARYARAIKSNELTVDKKNAALVEASSNINDVKAKLAEAITKNEALVEKVSTLYAGSEKVSGQLNESRKENAKLKEALSIRVQRIKEQTADLKDDANTIKIMQEKIDSLNAARIKEKK
jgi:predicted nuclease with TOPRIM domain